MIKIERYTAAKREEWDEHVRRAKNATFLFLRDYMDYHSDRFDDCSLMYYDEKERLVAVMPANRKGNQLWSHQGLTYGGVVMGSGMHASTVREVFDATIEYMRQEGISEWYYKKMPGIYATLPSEEDEYWLWRHGATMEACNIASVVDFTISDDMHRSIQNQRKQTYRRRLEQHGYKLDMDAPLGEFWAILEENLRQTYDAKPVHTLEEIERLKAAFEENIICAVARNREGEAEAGVLLFVSDRVVKTQYISASAQGKRTKALDYLIPSLIDHYRQQGSYRNFDLGTSNGDGGHYLNEGLILQKEGFGGRGVTYKRYLLKVSF